LRFKDPNNKNKTYRAMKVSELKNHLNAAPEHELRFVLPDGGFIPVHAHITEVGRTDRRFIDCGSAVRAVSSCTLQAWVAEDVDHRLPPGGLAAILGKAQPILGTDDLDVEIEYEDGLLSQFPVIRSDAEGGVLNFYLGLKHTDCLAKELCLPAGDKEEACCAGGGCC
jgi:hypothetical protein